MTQPTFVLDSSCLIKLHREQPLELYPSLWVRMSELLAHGDAVIPREADREMQAKDDELRHWLKQREASVVECTDAELELVRDIATKFSDWVRGSKNAADPFDCKC